ncbi:hypothetical protein L9F63_013930, partial [Diploptera punctata]
LKEHLRNVKKGEVDKGSSVHRQKEEEFDRVYQRIQLEEQENRHNIARHRRRSDKNNESGFIADNSGTQFSEQLLISLKEIE